MKKKNTSGEKKKHIGQGGCSSAKRAKRAHPQMVHWWVLIHSGQDQSGVCKIQYLHNIDLHIKLRVILKVVMMIINMPIF